MGERVVMHDEGEAIMWHINLKRRRCPKCNGTQLNCLTSIWGVATGSTLPMPTHQCQDCNATWHYEKD